MAIEDTHGHKASFLRSLVKGTVDSKLTPLLVLASILLGIFSIALTPSEEEPQIVVPMIDIFVSMPGASPSEMEARAVYPMEKLLWELNGVEYIYSTVMPGQSLTVVRFKVGEDVERSLVKVYDKLYSHFDWIPPGVSPPLLKPRSIDDVPILVLNFYKKGYDPITLRRIVSKLDEEIKSIQGVSATEIKGGQRRQALVLIDRGRLNEMGIDPHDVIMALRSQNIGYHPGEFTGQMGAISVKLEGFFSRVEDLQNTVIKVQNGRPVYLYQVADVEDRGEELNSYVLVGTREEAFLGVSYAVSKRKGENATWIANRVLQRVEALRGSLIPEDLEIRVSRNYGETAKEKVDELLKHLAIATFSVALLMALLL
ncbi:MAG: efflux RND transporter permease subunit, partial [Desulfatiglandales bacterium]